tara:strand:+ start:46 stop:267 length:222 start_codon:yes stop_codon:yes gene_type:complete
MEFYIKILCRGCRGKKRTWYGRHCPYCDNGTTFVKLPESSIIQGIMEMNQEFQEKLLSALEESNEDNKEPETT